MPLPCKSTIIRYLKSSNTGVGFDSEFFKMFEQQLNMISDLVPNARHGTLSFDEMSVRKAIGVNVKTMKFDGLLDYGDQALNDLQAEKSKKSQSRKKNQTPDDTITGDRADHALVFMFSSLTAPFHQPIGCFATSGAAPSEILVKLIITAILAVEKHGGFVHALVCDGAQTNRGIWKVFGATANVLEPEVVCCFNNPADENCETADPEDERKIYIVSDVPHLFKCIRNNLYAHQTFEVNYCFIFALSVTMIYLMRRSTEKPLIGFTTKPYTK